MPGMKAIKGPKGVISQVSMPFPGGSGGVKKTKYKKKAGK